MGFYSFVGLPIMMEPVVGVEGGKSAVASPTT